MATLLPAPACGELHAVIDLGTVTSRMLLVRVGNYGLSVLERHAVITHMGDGLAERGTISPAALDRVCSALEGFASLIPPGVPTRAIATSAMRDAANRDAACARIKRLGFDVEVVSGDREAALAFSGTLSGFALDHGEKLRTVMVVDVGGGSTEVIVGDLREAFAQESVGPSNARHDSSWPHERQASTVRQAKSFDIGSRRVTDMFLPSMPPGRDELAAANSWVAGQMSPYYAQLAQNGFMPAAVYAVAGTATTAASVFKELQVYDPTLVHGTILRIEDLEAILERLSALSLVQCCEVAGLDPLRAPVVVGGLVVLTNALRLSNVSQLVVSETDILEGVLLEALEQTSRRRSDT